VLATLVFILWAYGMYALISKFFQPKGGYLRGRSRWRRYGWLGLAGAIGAGLGFLLWLSLGADQADHRLQLSGFLGTVYAEGTPDKVDRRLQYPLVKPQAQGSQDQPAYALLHPETPSSQLEPEKKALKPRPSRKANLEKSPSAQVKGAKPAAKGANSDKLTAKNQTKKKKHSTAPVTKKATSG
jgi:hypothetical protein